MSQCAVDRYASGQGEVVEGSPIPKCLTDATERADANQRTCQGGHQMSMTYDLAKHVARVDDDGRAREYMQQSDDGHEAPPSPFWDFSSQRAAPALMAGIRFMAVKPITKAIPF